MKKILLCLAAIAAVLSCQKETETSNTTAEPAAREIPGTLRATFENGATRAGFTYDPAAKTYSHFWDEGDDIAVYPYDDVYDQYLVNDVSEGLFNLKYESSRASSASFDYLYAVYPYDAVYEVEPDDFEYEDGTIKPDGTLLLDLFRFPRVSEPPYGYGNVMVARTTTSELEFKNVVGWIKISLTGDIAVRSLTINSNGGYTVTGSVYVSFNSEGIPVVTPSEYNNRTQLWMEFYENPIRLSPDEPTDFYIPIIPGTLSEGFWVVMETSAGEKIIETNNPVTVERNVVTPMAVRNLSGPKAVLQKGTTFNATAKALAGASGAQYYTANNAIKSVVLDTFSSVTTGTEVQDATSEAKIYANFDSASGALTLSTAAGRIFANPSSASLFRGFAGAVSIDTDDLDFSEATSVENLFDGCAALKKAGSLSMPLAASAYSLFYGCSAITEIGDIYIPQATSTSQMLYLCSSLTSLGKITATNLRNVSTMFAGCSQLSSIDISALEGNLTDVNNMFNGCAKLSAIEFSNGFNTSAVTSMAAMFYQCRVLQSLDISGFDTANVTNMSNMFYACNILASITFGSGFNMSKVTTTKQMFQMCYRLTAIDFSALSAPVLEDAMAMFANCVNLTSVSLPVTTTALKNVASLFGQCSALTSFAPSSFAARPTTVSSMFGSCSKLTSIVLPSEFNTTDCNNYMSIFSGCTSLKNIVFRGLVVKGSGSPGLGTGLDFYAKFNNAFAGVSGCVIHCPPYDRRLGNSNPYNSFVTTNSSYTEGTRPTFAESTSATSAPAGYVYFRPHSEYVDALL